MKRFKLIICLILLFVAIGAYTSLHAQVKKYEYWFVVPDASRAHDDYPIFFMMTAGDLDAEVELSMPQNPAFTTQKKSLKANQSWRQDYTTAADVDILENSINNSGIATNKGVLITSTTPISVYYELNGYKSGQKEIFTLKGDKALGTEFYTPLQTYYSVYNYNGSYRQVQIVASENNTTVTFKAPIRVAKGTSGYFEANTENSVTLQRGQTLLVREYQLNATFTGGMGLMGTRVTANKPIAITTYEDSLDSGGAQDPIGDQIVPVNQVGTSYIVVKGFSKYANNNNGTRNTVDNVYILATKDNTVVKMDGVVKGTIAKAGGFIRFDIDDGYTDPQFRYFEASQPVYCLHQSAVGKEVGGALVPSMYSIASNKISFYNQNLSLTNSIFLIYREKAKDSFQIQFANQQNPVPLTVNNSPTGVDGWLFSKQALSGAEGTVTISNKDGAFALGYFASPGGTALYGYLSNFGKFAFKAKTIYAYGDSYTFDGGYAKSYKWTGPDGLTGNDGTLVATKSGQYTLEVDQDPDVIKDGTYLKLQNFDGEYNFPAATFINEPVDFSIKIQTTDPTGVHENDYNVEYEWTFSDEASTYSVTQTTNELGNPLTTDDKVEVKNVKWTTTGKKTITVKITNKTAGASTIITKNIIIHSYPDNVDTNINCWVDPPQTNYLPKIRGISENKIHSLAQLFVGDLDNDGNLEIVTTNMKNAPSINYSDSILIFNYDKTDDKIKLKKSIAVGNDGKTVMFTTTTTPLALVRLPGEQQALIVVACDQNGNMQNQKLKAFRQDGSVAWTANANIFNNDTPTDFKKSSVSIVIGDVDNDGIPEILAGDRIFCGKTGKLLVDLPGYTTDPLHGRGGRNLNSTNGWNNNDYSNFITMPVLADVDNDGTLEVIGGNTSYKITINDRQDPSKNKAEVLARAKGINYDGFVSVADINLDGRLDVVSITNSLNGTNKPSLVVWDAVTGDIIAGPISPDIAGIGGSRVFIGDVDFHADSRGYPELFYSYGMQLIAYKYDPDPLKPVADRLVFWWNQKTTDRSGATTLSMFDFDQSGSPKLVYRDEDNLRIINAVTGDNMDLIPCFSATHSEYPIVVDLDQNGHADILVSGAASTPIREMDVRIYWFSGTNDDWAPARKVWNQHGYNSVNVNEDLTVPVFQFNPSTTFPGKNGNKVRPYNGYLLQQTTLNRDGDPLYPAPNIQIQNANKLTYSYDNITDMLIISNLELINIGDGNMIRPIMISIYDKQIKVENLITTYVGKAINKDETVILTIKVPNFGKYLPTSNLVISINDDGTGKTKEPVCEECDPNESGSFANVDLSTLAWLDPYKNCIGGSVKFNGQDLSTTGNNVTYEWLKPDGTMLVNVRNTQKTNLQLSDGGRYTMVVKGINNDLSVKYTLPDLSVAPPTMYWSGKKDSNWNNVDNWASDINGTALNPKAIPASCTNVHIPYLSEALINYPSLDPIVTPQNIKQGPTGVYGKPEVNEITFHYGSELAYPHQLEYNHAKVQYNFGYYSTSISGTQPTANKDGSSALSMKRNRWYALAAPLKNMATGDFAFGGYPYTWQALSDIISGNQITFDGNNVTNDINLAKSNNAIVVKSGLYQSGQTGYGDHRYLQGLKGILEIPYYDNATEIAYHPGHIYDRFTGYSTFYYYNVKTLQTVYDPVGKMKRGEESYRFIFENDNNKIDLISLNGETVACYVMTVDVTSSKHALIGNPFIASINMDRFYEANQGALELNEGYRLYVDNSGLEWKKFDYKMTNGTFNAVNSLQSFIVGFKAAGANQKLYFPLEGTYALTGTKTNVTPRRLELLGALSVNVKSNDGVEGDYAELSPASQNDLTTNVSKLISVEDSQTPEVFLIGRNNAGYNLMQVFETEDNEIRLGVRYANTKNDLTLTFSQINEFASLTGTTPVLIDKINNVEQDLITKDTYTFRQAEVNEKTNYTDTERFAIRFNENNNTLSKDNELTVNYINNSLIVNSSFGLQKVELYNLSGQQIFSSPLLNSQDTHYSKSINLPISVYIVKATGADNKTKSCKFIVQ